MVSIEVVEDDEVEEEKIERRQEPTSSFKHEEVGSEPEELSGYPSVPLSDATAVTHDNETGLPAKSKKKGEVNGGSNGEGDGWETASEGDDRDGAVDEKSYNDESQDDSDNENIATTLGDTQEDFEDALTEEELCLRQYAEAVKESTEALNLDPNYVKALMRRAQAQENLDKLEDAIADLNKVLEIDPGNRQARDTIQRLEPIVAEKRENEGGNDWKTKGARKLHIGPLWDEC